MSTEAQGRSNGLKKFEVFCGLLLCLAVAVSLGEIVGRVFFKTTYDFIIDLSVWLTVWAMLLISGPLLAEEGHVSIEFILSKLKGRSRVLLELFNVTATLVYGAAVTWGGVLLVYSLHDREAVFPRYFPIPKWLVELCVPIGMALFTLFAIMKFFQTLKRLR